MLCERATKIAGVVSNELEGFATNGAEAVESFCQSGRGARRKYLFGSADAPFTVEGEGFETGFAGGIGVGNVGGCGLAQLAQKQCLRGCEMLDDFKRGPAAGGRAS